MKSKNPYNILSNYCLRTPSYSYDVFKHITTNHKIADSTFKQLFKDTFFIKSLQLASPDLLEQFQSWVNGNVTDPNKIETLQFSILKYLIRITTRATPFGLFAGCSMGSFSTKSSIHLKPIDNFSSFSSLDMSFLSKLIDELSNKANIKNKVVFYPNSSLYKIGDQYRYTSYTYEDNHRVYHLDYTFRVFRNSP